MKKCKSCGKQFEPSNSIQSACQLKCALKLSAAKTKQKATEKKQLNLKLKESLKTLGDYKKELQVKINKIVRLIDFNCNCLACGTNKGKFDASHFRGVKAWDNLRYNLFNIYSGCAQCNTFKDGNLIKFREGIVITFGEETINYMDDLNVIYPFIKLNKTDFSELNKKCNEIIKELNLLNTDIIKRSIDDRIQLRKKYNNYLGIYN
jgi:hypothetical protein